MRSGQCAYRLLDIAHQAAQEAALEALLHGIHTKWSGTEFRVAQYKGQRDSYILAGFDDILALLEESNISMTSALSNRWGATLLAHVGPGIACRPGVERRVVTEFSARVSSLAGCD